jgi:pimeloyl-ACP methyl ester carboxylesterase
MKTKFMLAIISLICVWLLASAYLRVSSTSTIFNTDPSFITTNETGYTQFFLNGIGDNKISVHKYDSVIPTDKIIIYTHGNAGRLNYYFPELQKVGTVYSPTYPGYGESEGKPSMDGAYDAALKTYDYLIKEGKLEKNITIFGHSLGGSIATYLASQRPNANKLVLANTFSSLQSMCWRQYSILCIFAGDLLNSAENAKKVTMPVVQFAIKSDQTVPYSEGEKLFTYFKKDTSKFIEMKKDTHAYLDWELIRPEL